jgi:hypothetical protein
MAFPLSTSSCQLFHRRRSQQDLEDEWQLVCWHAGRPWERVTVTVKDGETEDAVDGFVRLSSAGYFFSSRACSISVINTGLCRPHAAAGLIANVHTSHLSSRSRQPFDTSTP